MDFAELSGLEFKFFDDYKQEVVNQFTQDIHSEIHSVEYDYFVSWKGSSARAAKAIPLVGSVVGLCDKFTDQKELAKGNLTYDISKSIKERVISKFSDTLSDVGKTFNKVMVAVNTKIIGYQEEIASYEEIIQDKTQTIESLNFELDLLKNILFDESQATNEALEIKRLKYQLRSLNILNKNLQTSIKNLKDRQHLKDLSEARAQKVKAKDIPYEAENIELKKRIEYLAKLTKQLQEQVNEKNKTPKVNPLDEIANPLYEGIADLLGMKDYFNFLKKSFNGIRGIVKGIQVLSYSYLLFISVDYFIKCLSHYYFLPHKIYAALVFPVIVFLIFKLSKF